MKQMMNWIKENKWSAAGILIILLAIVIGTARADTDSCMTGSWHDPTVESEGVTLQVLDNGVLAQFYTYAETGNAHRWYYMLFDADGKAVIGTTKDKANRQHQKVGNATFDAIGPDEILILMRLTIDIDDPPWCIGCEKILLYNRLTEPVACE